MLSISVVLVIVAFILALLAVFGLSERVNLTAIAVLIIATVLLISNLAS